LNSVPWIPGSAFRGPGMTRTFVFAVPKIARHSGHRAAVIRNLSLGRMTRTFVFAVPKIARHSGRRAAVIRNLVRLDDCRLTGSSEHPNAKSLNSVPWIPGSAFRGPGMTRTFVFAVPKIARHSGHRAAVIRNLSLGRMTRTFVCAVFKIARHSGRRAAVIRNLHPATCSLPARQVVICDIPLMVLS